MSSSLEELTAILDRVLSSLEPWTDLPRGGVPSAGPRTAESAPTVVLTLPRAEALAGTRREIRFTVTDLCTRCGGSGTIGARGRNCRRCKGAGTIAVERRLRLKVPPGVTNGTELRVHGEGSVHAAGEVASDLLVQIQIKP